MKRISVNVLTNVVLLLAGALLIVFYSLPDVMNWVARVMGGVFLLPSLAFLLMVALRKRDNRGATDFTGIMPAIGGLCFGLLMILKPGLFAGVLTMLMGTLLLVLGLFHLVFLLLSVRSIDVRGWYFLLPLLVTAAGAIILFVPDLRDHNNEVVLVTGISLILFNVTSFQEYLAERRTIKARLAQRTADDEEPTLPTISAEEE